LHGYEAVQRSHHHRSPLITALKQAPQDDKLKKTSRPPCSILAPCTLPGPVISAFVMGWKNAIEFAFRTVEETPQTHLPAQ